MREPLIHAEREARKVLCQRIRSAAPGIFGREPCNGATVVCGFCDHTARLQIEAVVEALRATPTTEDKGREDRA